ncbi:hypothetical protein L195_g060975, partial [Trifolium pratense]
AVPWRHRAAHGAFKDQLFGELHWVLRHGAEELRMAQQRLVLKVSNAVSCVTAQSSCAWRMMNIWEVNLDLEVMMCKIMAH